MKDMGTSTWSHDLIEIYSSKGPTALDHVVKPDILAPGNRVTSTIDYTASALAQARESSKSTLTDMS